MLEVGCPGWVPRSSTPPTLVDPLGSRMAISISSHYSTRSIGYLNIFGMMGHDLVVDQ